MTTYVVAKSGVRVPKVYLELGWQGQSAIWRASQKKATVFTSKIKAGKAAREHDGYVKPLGDST